MFKQGLFTKIIAWGKPGKKILSAFLARACNFHTSLINYIKAVWLVVALKDRLSVGHFALDKRLCNAGKLILLQAIEEVDLIQENNALFMFDHGLILSNFTHN